MSCKAHSTALSTRPGSFNQRRKAFPKLDGGASVAVSSLEAVDLGAHPSLEIAYLLSAVLARYRASAENNGTFEQAIALYATTESTLFMNIAKLRSLRRLYEGIRKSLAISAPWELMTLSSPRAWTRDAPWNNQLRGTASIMSASIAGATSIGILPATHTLESQRVALSAHSVIALESHLGQVDDPARGSYLIETLTEALAQKAWALFNPSKIRWFILASRLVSLYNTRKRITESARRRPLPPQAKLRGSKRIPIPR